LSCVVLVKNDPLRPSFSNSRSFSPYFSLPSFSSSLSTFAFVRLYIACTAITIAPFFLTTQLPPVKLHCSMLAEDAIKAAVKDLKTKQKEAAAGGATKTDQTVGA